LQHSFKKNSLHQSSFYLEKHSFMIPGTSSTCEA